MKTNLLGFVLGFIVLATFSLKSQSGVYLDLHIPEVMDILESSPGELFVAATNEVIHYTNEYSQKTSYNVQSISSFAAVANVLKYKNGKVYLGLNNGLFYFNGNGWTNIGGHNAFSALTDIEITNDTTIWCLANGAVYKYESGFFVPQGKFGDCLTSFNNTLYVGNSVRSQPVDYFENGSWNALPPNATLFNGDHVYDLEIDQNGVLWNIHRDGISKYSNQVWTNLYSQPNFQFRSMAILDSTLYLNSRNFSGYDNDFIFRLDAQGVLDTLINISHDPLSIPYVIKPGLRGNLFLGTLRQWDLSGHVFNFFPDEYARKNYKELSINEIKAGVSSSGDLFRDFELDHPFVGLRAGGKTSVFASNVWLSATKPNGDSLTALNMYGQNGTDYLSGPYSQEYDADYIKKFDKVWKVTRAEIDVHRTQWLNTSYVAPEDITTWPGNGDQALGQTQYLAPFIDHNSNGIYEPEKGEYPDIRGDEALYFIFNDVRGPKSHTLSPSMGVEIHAMMYAYDSISASELHNSIFFSYKLHNKSSEDLNNLRFAFWMDPDLGNSIDDLIGCDSTTNVFYTYNGDNDDQGPQGYGLNPPAVGGMILSDSLDGFMYFNNQSSGNPIFATTEPEGISDYINQMNSRWKGGEPLRIESPSGPFSGSNGDGYEPGGSSSITKFAYNDAVNWYGNPSFQQDKRVLPIVDLGTLKAGADRCIDLAIIYARDPSAGVNSYSPVTRLKGYAQNLKQFYVNEDFECLSESIGIEEEIVEAQVDFYPNPICSGGILNIAFGKEVESVRFIDTQGRMLLSNDVYGEKVFELRIPANASNGLYFVEVQGIDKKISTLKISVQ